MTDDLGGEAMTIIERNGGTHQRIMLHELPDYIFHRYSTVNLTIPLGDLPHKNSYPYRRCKERCELFVGEESSVVSSREPRSCADLSCDSIDSLGSQDRCGCSAHRPLTHDVEEK